jgi:purine nucleosidase
MQRITAMYFLSLLGAVLASGSAAADDKKPDRIPVILDCDIGDDIDDAFALALTLASPELDLRGVTTVFEDAHTRGFIACRMLHAAGRSEVPVATGRPAQETPAFKGQFQYGLRPAPTRPVKDRAVDFLYKQLKARPGELTLLAVGPLTNMAELVTKYPDCKPWIKRLVIMGGSVRVGYNMKPPVDPEWNIKADVKSAQIVFAAGLPLTVAPLDATAHLKLEGDNLRRVFKAQSPLANQLEALYQLWGQPTPILFDPMAVTLCFTDKFCTMEDLRLEVDDKGITKIVDGAANARVATSARGDEYVAWFVKRLADVASAEDKILAEVREAFRKVRSAKSPLKELPAFDAVLDKITPRILALPKERQQHVLKAIGGLTKQTYTNPSRPCARGNLPQRIHVIEDYETDIERRWWLCGLPETKNVPPGSKRACRGVLTNDFDGRHGDTSAMYTAVVFNPVPGPPMGPHTRLSFNCWLKGTSRLKVQLYTLSKNYHRHLTLSDIPQGSWQSLTVDMTQARKPDGSGGPLAEDERIDDIQFYTDRDAELLIGNVVLYDAAKADEKRPFPSRPIYTAWFDTGKQGKEWPGHFELVPKAKPHTWRAAKSVKNSETGNDWIRLDLRGKRKLGKNNFLQFQYHLTGGNALDILILDRKSFKAGFQLRGLKQEQWTEAQWNIVAGPEGIPLGVEIEEIHFHVPAGGQLLLDDVLVYER